MLASGEEKSWAGIVKKLLGRPLAGAEPRERLFASVAAPTARQLEAWTADARAFDDSTRVGQVIDALVAHGLASRWSPRKCPPETGNSTDKA